ncbi:MAG TPA: hypothetical protein VH593_07125 [Ktedonobacteraceae bacterium]|jgi:hypothetical protein
MVTSPTLPTVIQQKLEAFERLQPEFEACFQFVEDVHGQRRFPSFSLGEVVRYLHALWICEYKDRLLSIHRNIRRYEGQYCLQLLRLWQEEEDTASVIEFLQRKLDTLPVAAVTRQIHEAYEARHVHMNDGLAQRLVHGRMILLNRGINLMHVLDAICMLSEEELHKAVQTACEQYDHLPQQIAQQLEELNSPLTAYISHQALAQRNMAMMNWLGVQVTFRPSDLPGLRSWRVVAPIEPMSPYAEHVVIGYQEMTSPLYNNIRRDQFIDPPEHNNGGTV